MNKKNSIVIVICIITCIFFSLFNGRNQLNKKVQKIETVFENGVNNDGLSIKYDLEKIDDSIGNTLMIAKNSNYSDENTKELETLHQSFESISNIKGYYNWYNSVKKIYPTILNDLSNTNLSSQYSSMLKKYESTYNSSIHTIAYETDYNGLVQTYNRDTSNLIAKMIKKLGVKEVVTFE